MFLPRFDLFRKNSKTIIYVSLQWRYTHINIYFVHPIIQLKIMYGKTHDLNANKQLVSTKLFLMTLAEFLINNVLLCLWFVLIYEKSIREYPVYLYTYVYTRIPIFFYVRSDITAVYSLHMCTRNVVNVRRSPNTVNTF